MRAVPEFARLRATGEDTDFRWRASLIVIPFDGISRAGAGRLRVNAAGPNRARALEPATRPRREGPEAGTAPCRDFDKSPGRFIFL